MAFRIAKANAFYLYSFTECEDFEQKRCHLFYKQPRDDPNNDHKFPLQAINNQLLESLKDKKRVFRFRGEALQSSMDYIYMQGELYTLRLIDGEFWLHQYSEQNFKIGPNGMQKLIGTQIVYRQSRDDPQREHPINFRSLDSNFQEDLLSKCKKSGYCL
ncbi:hypothetical protein [Helicobacter suis]|uniref:hypothetical protein n=1 Tax=Helicobacter suis TaxID=104628 RepID=UPI0013D2D717|nr:hypothetical protein [Helicobacter suis]